MVNETYKNRFSVILKFTKIETVKAKQDPYLKNERRTREPVSIPTLETGGTPSDQHRSKPHLSPTN
jgi:hypothetical protein